eukprot:159594_1
MGSAFKYSTAIFVIFLVLLLSGCDARSMIEEGARSKIAAREETYSTSTTEVLTQRRANFNRTRRRLRGNSRIIERPDSANRRELSARAPSSLRSRTHTPSSTTNAPTFSTNAPMLSTNAPALRTYAPSSTSNAPSSTTNAPSSSTNSPSSSTNAPSSRTNSPSMNKRDTSSTTNAPSSTTNSPSYNTN